MAYKSTKATAAAVGLTERELRRGFRAGIYPALQIGDKGGRLRFDPDQVIRTLQELTQIREEALCQKKKHVI